MKMPQDIFTIVNDEVRINNRSTAHCNNNIVEPCHDAVLPSFRSGLANEEIKVVSNILSWK